MFVGDYRRPIRNFAVNRRYGGSSQTAMDIRNIHKAQNMLNVLIQAFRRVKYDPRITVRKKMRLKLAIAYTLERYSRLTRLPPHIHLRYPARNCTIRSYHAQNIATQFRFQDHSQIVSQAFSCFKTFSRVVVLDNGCQIS